MNTYTHILQRIRDLYGTRYEPEHIHVLAAWYWRALLVVAACAVCGTVCYGVVSMMSVLHTLASYPDTSPLPPPALDRSALNTLVAGIDARTHVFESLRTNPPAPVEDPSK